MDEREGGSLERDEKKKLVLDPLQREKLASGRLLACHAAPSHAVATSLSRSLEERGPPNEGARERMAARRAGLLSTCRAKNERGSEKFGSAEAREKEARKKGAAGSYEL